LRAQPSARFRPGRRQHRRHLAAYAFCHRSVPELDHGSPCRGAFWSWLWGITGALIAIHLTAALIIVCQNFPSSRWLAILLSKAIEASNRGPNARKGFRRICILCGSHAFKFKAAMFLFELQCRKPRERETMGVLDAHAFDGPCTCSLIRRLIDWRRGGNVRG
jgi:hypothetical protein